MMSNPPLPQHPPRPLPELELRLIARRAERRRRALLHVRGHHSLKELSWLALGIGFYVLLVYGPYWLGGGAADVGGATRSGLGPTLLLVGPLVFFAVRILLLERRVEALIQLVMDDPADARPAMEGESP